MMENQDRVPVITAIAYELGEMESVADLAASEEEDAIEILLATGMKEYSRSKRRISELVVDCIRRTLSQAEVDPKDVDVVVYATETFWDASEVSTHRETNRQYRQDIFRAIWETGLHDAFPYGVTFSGCGNFVSGVKLAACMLMAKQAKNVLVVTGDRHPPKRTRILPPAVTVISDGAASCLVTCERAAGFAVHEVCQRAYLDVFDVDLEDDFGRFLVEMARTLRTLGGHMHERTCRTPKDYRRLLVNNYSLSTARVFSHLLGYETSQLYLDNIARVGHVSAADALINLFDLDQAGALNHGDHLMILGTGPVTTGLMAVEKIGA